MVTLRLLKNIVGFSLKGIGFFWSFFDKFLCGSISQSNECSSLLLFAGILFIISGYALIIMKDEGRKSLKKKIKRAITLVNKR